MMADLYLPPKAPLLVPQKPAIIRASRLPQTPAEARGIRTVPPLALGLGSSFASLLASQAASGPLTFVNAFGINSSSNQYNFNLIAVGPGTKVIGVILHGEGNGSISSVVIDGTNGTLPVQPVGGVARCGFAWREISSETINIQVNWSASINRCGIGVFAVRGYSSATATTDTDSSASTNSLSVGLSNDVWLAGCTRNQNAATTLSGQDIEHYNGSVGGGGTHMSAGSKAGAGTITASWETAADPGAMIAAGWNLAA